MSDIRFNQWLHQSGTGGVSQVDGGHVGIGTTNPDIAVHSANAKKLNVGIITANSVYAGNFYGNGSNLSGLAADKIFEGDTKVEVVDSGSQYIVAEVNGGEKLRINSSGNLLLGTTSSAAGQLIIKDTTNAGNQLWMIGRSSDNTSSVSFRNNADNAYVARIQCDSNAGMQFEMGGSEKLRIDSNGRLLIGTTTVGESGADELTIENLSSDMGITLRTATNRQGTIMFSDSTSGAGQYAGAIQYAHNAHAGADSMKFYTNSTQRMTIQSDGGIDINSTKALKLHSGSTSDRPTGINGMIRYNTSNNSIEGYIDGGWILIKGSGFSENGTYNNNTVAVADDLHSYWNCNSTNTSLNGGDSGQATLYGVSSAGGKIGNSWDRGGNGTGNSLDYTNGIYLTSMPTGNNWTFGFQLYLHNDQIWSASDGAGIIWLDGRLSGGTPGSVILGYDGNTGDNLRFGGNGWISDGVVVESSFAEQTWYHMVISKNGNTWKFYLDGSLKATRTESMTESGNWMIGNYSRINGNGNNNAHFFRGKIDEIGVWHRTLSDDEVSNWYTAQSNGTVLVQ